MAESLDEFFSEDVLTKSDIRDEAALIHDYLVGNITVQTIAQRLVQSLQARNAPSRDGPYDFSEILETVVVGVAEQLPETHNALVALLGKLKPHSETSKFDSVLASTLNERWLRYGDPDQSLNVRDEVRNEWTNLNHFAALIYKANLQDLSSFAVQTLWMALRRRGWRVNWDGQSTSDNIIALEGHAPAAAHWIIVCGQRLYDECSDAERKWSEWEADLEWIVGQPNLNDAIKSLCQQALAEMRRIAA